MCPRGCWESAEYYFPQPLGHSTYSSSGVEELEILSKLLWRPVAYTYLHIKSLPNFSANQEEIKANSIYIFQIFYHQQLLTVRLVVSLTCSLYTALIVESHHLGNE